MFTKKKNTKPQRQHILRCTRSHIRFSRWAPLFLYPIMTKKWARNVRSEMFSTIFRPKKKNPILKKKSTLNMYYNVYCIICVCNFRFVLFFPWDTLPLHSDWSLSCDPELGYASKWENNNNNTDGRFCRPPTSAILCGDLCTPFTILPCSSLLCKSIIRPRTNTLLSI